MSEKFMQNTMWLHEAIDYVFAHSMLHWRGEKVLIPYICGKPGGGKSEMIEYKAKTNNVGYMPVTVGLIRPERFTGIPDFTRTQRGDREVLGTVWSEPEIVYQLNNLAEKHDRVICLFDDWHIASPEIQASAFELATHFSINGYPISRKVAFVFAGNNSPAAGARSSFSAVMNRVCKINVETNFDYWRDAYAYKNDLDDEIISFLDNSSNRIYFHGEEQTKDPWPSPRSWTSFAKIFKSIKKSSTKNILFGIAAGHVGNKAASEFMLYHEIYGKVNTKEIFGKGIYKIPQDPIDRFAFTSAVTSDFYHRIKTEGDADNKNKYKGIYGKILQDLEKNCKEMAIKSIRMLCARDFQIAVDLVKEKHISPKSIEELTRVSKFLNQ